VIDLERRGPGSFRVRRQVIHRAPDVWVVLDGTEGDNGDRASTVWTTAPENQVSPGPNDRSFRLVPPGASIEMHAAFEGSTGTTIHSFQGSFMPFAGWVVHRGVPTETNSIVVDRDVPHSWAATVWNLRPRADESVARAEEGSPVQVHYRSPADWTVSLSPWLGGGTLRRNGDLVTASGARGAVETVTFAPVPVDTLERARIDQSFESFVRLYPRARDLIPERSTVTRFLIPIAIVLEIALFVLWRLRLRAELPIRAAVLVGWVAAGAWLTRVYFVTG